MASQRASSDTSTRSREAAVSERYLGEAISSEVYLAQEWRLAALDARCRDAEARTSVWRMIATILFAGYAMLLAYIAVAYTVG